MRLTLWLGYAFVMTAVGGELPNYLEHLPGAIMETMGTVYPITERIRILVNLSPFEALATTLHNHAKQLNLIKTQINMDTMLSDKHAHTLLLAANATHATIHKGLEDTGLTYVKHTKTKRGLFDIIGVGMHTLFGVTDDRTLNKRLHEYEQQLQSVTHTYNASAKAINAVERNILKLNDAFQVLSNNTPSFDELDSYQRFTQYAFLLNHYQLALVDTIYTQRDVQRALTHAALGHVDRTLLSPSNFLQVITMLRLKQSIPLFDLLHETTLFYATLSSYLTDEGIVVILPLKPKQSFTAYNIHPFPQTLNNSAHLVTLHTKPLILFNTTSRAIITPQTPLDDACTNPGRHIYVCDTPTWFLDMSPSTCERAIVTRQNNVRDSCTLEEHIPGKLPFILPTQYATLLYFYTKDSVNIFCDTPQPNVVPVQGPFVLPRTCALGSVSLTLPATHTFKTNFTMDIPTFTPTSFHITPLHHLHTPNNYTLEAMNVIPEETWFISTHVATTYLYPIGVVLAAMVFSGIAICACLYSMRQSQLNYLNANPPAYSA